MIKVNIKVLIFYYVFFWKFYQYYQKLNQDLVEKPEYTVIVEKQSSDEDFFSTATEATNPGCLIPYLWSPLDKFWS